MATTIHSLTKLAIVTAIGLACSGAQAKDISGLAAEGGADASEVYFVKTLYEQAIATNNQAVLTLFASVTNKDDAARLALELAPDRSGSSVYNVLSAQTGFSEVIRKRAQEFITTDLGSTSVWVSLLGSESTLYADSNAIDRFDGYDATSKGIAMGYDWLMSERFVFGLAFGQQSTDSDNRLSNLHQSIDSYHAAAHGIYQFDELYLAGQALVGWSNHSVTRHVGRGFYTGKNDVQGQQNGDNYGLALDLYQPLYFDTLMVTPSLYSRYSLVRIDDYKEHYAENFALAYQAQEYQEFNVGAGVELTHQWAGELGMFTSQFGVRAEHELLDHTLSTKVALVGASNEFVMPVNQLDDTTYQMNLDFAWETNGSLSFHVGAQHRWSESLETTAVYGRGTLSF